MPDPVFAEPMRLRGRVWGADYCWRWEIQRKTADGGWVPVAASSTAHHLEPFTVREYATESVTANIDAMLDAERRRLAMLASAADVIVYEAQLDA